MSPRLQLQDITFEDSERPLDFRIDDDLEITRFGGGGEDYGQVLVRLQVDGQRT
jgi:hypothetical protein